MRNTETYTEDGYEVYGGELVESIPAKRSLSTMLTSRAGSLMLQDAMLPTTTAGQCWPRQR